MPSSMIRDREIVYSPNNRRWHWGDTGEVLDEDVEAKHFSTDPPGMVWETEEPSGLQADDPPADPPPAE